MQMPETLSSNTFVQALCGKALRTLNLPMSFADGVSRTGLTLGLDTATICTEYGK
jgi:hypothetical protein